MEQSSQRSSRLKDELMTWSTTAQLGGGTWARHWRECDCNRTSGNRSATGPLSRALGVLTPSIDVDVA